MGLAASSQSPVGSTLNKPGSFSSLNKKSGGDDWGFLVEWVCDARANLSHSLSDSLKFLSKSHDGCLSSKHRVGPPWVSVTVFPLMHTQSLSSPTLQDGGWAEWWDPSSSKGTGSCKKDLKQAFRVNPMKLPLSQPKKGVSDINFNDSVS